MSVAAFTVVQRVYAALLAQQPGQAFCSAVSVRGRRPGRLLFLLRPDAGAEAR